MLAQELDIQWEEERWRWEESGHPKDPARHQGPSLTLNPVLREDWKFKWMTSKVITSTKSAQLERILAVALGSTSPNVPPPGAVFEYQSVV